jgi:hypothetical protein
MRKLAPVLLVVLAGATAAHAEDLTSCRTQATLAADEWVKGNIFPGSEADQMEPAPLVVIAYGKKYGAAHNAMDLETLRPHMLGSLIKQRKEVYKEELDRCLGHFTVKIIGVEPAKYKRLSKKAPWPETID